MLSGSWCDVFTITLRPLSWLRFGIMFKLNHNWNSPLLLGPYPNAWGSANIQSVRLSPGLKLVWFSHIYRLRVPVKFWVIIDAILLDHNISQTNSSVIIIGIFVPTNGHSVVAITRYCKFLQNSKGISNLNV